MCKILVVDDDADLRECMAEELSLLGHDVVTACDGKEALNWLADDLPSRPCLILLDLRMPVMDGFDLLQALRRNVPWVRQPVVVLSATCKPGADPPVLCAQAFWTKPPSGEQIRNIHQYCGLHRNADFAASNR